MIFKIVDGRSCFYQWDIDRQVSVADPTIKELHFCNRSEECSLVVEVVDGIANVPNKVLQKGYPVRVFGYDGKATLHEATFEVKARTKPIDYIYTETEIKHYEDLEKRLDKIEAEGFDEEVVNNAVYNYLEENSVNLDNYYNKEEIHHLLPEVPTKVSELTNDKEYVSINDRIINRTSLLFLSQFKDNQIGPTNRVETFNKNLATGEIIRWAGSNNTSYPWYSHNITEWHKCNADGTFSKYVSGGEPNVLKQGYYYIGYSAKLYEFESFELLKKALSNSIVYDNSTSGLTATTVVEAINELAKRPSGGGGSGADLSNYYTKEETDQVITATKDVVHLDFTYATRENTPATAEHASIFDRIYNGEQIAVYTNAHVNNTYTFYVTTEFNISSDTIDFTAHYTDPNHSPVLLSVIKYKAKKTSNSWTITKVNSSNVNLATLEDINGAEVDLSSCTKFYNFSSLDNPSEEDYNKLREILEAGELNAYEFTIANSYKVLRASDLDGLNVLFVYGLFNGATDTTFFGYQVDVANSTSTLLTSYKMVTPEEVTQTINEALRAIGVAEGGAY